MPSKIQLDENLWFLFICLQKSDYKTIDFNAVGQATNLKSPAARMRYTRLRRQIEGGTLIGTHGTPFSGVAEKMSPDMRKRTRDCQPEVGEGEQPTMFAKTTSPDRKIKLEPEEFSDRNETDFSGGDDSEDEMPLAKRRNDKVKPSDVSSKSASMAIRPPRFSSGVHDGQDNHNRPLQPNTQLDISQCRPEIHEEYLKMVQNSNLNGHLYMQADHRFDVTVQPLKGNEYPRHS